MNVSINTASMGGFAGQMQIWAAELSWLWDLRTDKDFTYTGTTSATSPASGDLLIRMGGIAEWTSLGGTTTTPNAYTIGSGGGQLIVFNPHIALGPLHGELMMHEAGHAGGYINFFSGFHSNDQDDIMYPTVGLGNFPISTADANGVIVGGLPSVDTADKTSAYLRADNDMFIPDINVNGSIRQIQLNYDGVVNLGSGAKHTWTIWSNTANEEGSGGTGTVTGASVSMGGVQSMGADYTSVLMTVVGSTQVQLESWV